MKRPDKADAETVLEAIEVSEEQLGPEKYHHAVVALARLTGAAVVFVDSGKRPIPALGDRTEPGIVDGLVDVKGMAQTSTQSRSRNALSLFCIGGNGSASRER